MDAAVAFYPTSSASSWCVATATSGRSSTAGPVRFALHGTDDEPAAPSGTVVFRVDDLDAARWALEQRGAAFDEQVGEVEGYARFATFRDPDGNPCRSSSTAHGR